MAEIKVRITGDNADFKKKLEESSAESRLMAAEMHEQFSQVKDKVLDVAGENGLGSIAKILGGLSTPIAAFGTAIVAAVGEGIKKTLEWQDLVVRTGTLIGSQGAGKEVAEFIEKAASVGVGPSKDQLMLAYQSMVRGNISPEDAKQWIPRIQNLAQAHPEIGAPEWGEMIGGGSVGITRGLMHNEDVRKAMSIYGQNDPLRALFTLGGPGGLYGNAILDKLNTTGGQMSATGRGVGEALESVGKFLTDPLDAMKARESAKGTITYSDKPMGGVYVDSKTGQVVHFSEQFPFNDKPIPGLSEKDFPWNKNAIPFDQPAPIRMLGGAHPGEKGGLAGPGVEVFASLQLMNRILENLEVTTAAQKEISEDWKKIMAAQ